MEEKISKIDNKILSFGNVILFLKIGKIISKDFN